MRKQFLIWLSVVAVLFILGSTIGENRGTSDTFLYWPIVIATGGGLLYFGAWGVKGLINKKKK